MSQVTKGSRPGTIVGTGLIALDLVYAEGSELPRIWAGGTCGNVLAILAYLGWSAFPVARLDSEGPAMAIEEDLSRWGVHSTFLRVGALAPAPIVVEYIRTTRDGAPVHRFSFKCPNCGSWLPAYRPITAEVVSEISSRLPTSDVFFFDRASRGSIDLANELKKRGAAVFFEPSSVGQPRLFEQALAIADIVKYSVERLEFIDLLSETCPSPWLEVITLGEEGIRYRRRTRSGRMGRWRDQPAFSLNGMLDTAGAGDWATAALLHSLRTSEGITSTVSDKQLNHAFEFAQAAAAWACKFEGARGGMYAASPEEFSSDVAAISRQTELQSNIGDKGSALRKLPPTVCPSCS